MDDAELEANAIPHLSYVSPDMQRDWTSTSRSSGEQEQTDALADPPAALSVIVPMYNEAPHISELYRRLVAVLEPLCERFEILCIDDGSSDETYATLKSLHEHDRRVRVIRLSRNFGKECAMTAGLDFCRGDLVVILDADLQHPPECIPELVSRIGEGYDVVYAVRRSRLGQGWLRRIASDAFHWTMHRIGSVEIVDGAGDFRIMNKQVVRALRRLRESQRYMKGLFAWAGFRTSTILFDQVPRSGGESRWEFRALVRLAIEAVTSFSDFPLRAITYLGFLIGLSSVGGGLAASVHLIAMGPVAGWIPIFVVLATCALQIICLGVVGEYVGKSYAEAKRRPLYFVRNSLGERAGGWR